MNNTKKIFVADVSKDVENIRNKLCTILKRAQLEPIIATNNATNNDIIELMKTCCGSVHILGSEDICQQDSSGNNSCANMQYHIATELCNDDFKLFLWNVLEKQGNHQQYINSLRHKISRNIIYSNKISPIMFVEELRDIVTKQKNTTEQSIENKDILFIYNELDKDTAIEIINMLEDVLTVKSLTISMSIDANFSEQVKNQLPHSKLCVVYYNFANDWGINFIRQVWKDNGGLSSATPVMLIGNVDHADENKHKIFKDVIKTVVCDTTLIPLEIKVFYDKIVEEQ